WPRLDDLLWRHNLLHYGTSERGHLVVVDGDGVQPADADVGRGASSGGDPGGDLVDALMQKILDIAVKGANSAAQLGARGDDIRRGSGMEGANGDHGRVPWIHLPADDALKLGDDGGANGNRIHGLLRRGAMATDAVDRDLEGISTGLQRA